jgi:hypothetical protein
MVRLKIAIAVTADALVGGLAAPSAASADTAPVAYAWGYHNWGQAGVDPAVAGHRPAQPGARPRGGSQRDAAVRPQRQLQGPVRPVAALGRHGVGLGPELHRRAG